MKLSYFEYVQRAEQAGLSNKEMQDYINKYEMELSKPTLYPKPKSELIDKWTDNKNKWKDIKNKRVIGG